MGIEKSTWYKVCDIIYSHIIPGPQQVSFSRSEGSATNIIAKTSSDLSLGSVWNCRLAMVRSFVANIGAHSAWLTLWKSWQATCWAWPGAHCLWEVNSRSLRRVATDLLCWSHGPNGPTWPFPAVRHSSGRRGGSSRAAVRLRLCPRVCRRACQVSGKGE